MASSLAKLCQVACRSSVYCPGAPSVNMHVMSQKWRKGKSYTNVNLKQKLRAKCNLYMTTRAAF